MTGQRNAQNDSQRQQREGDRGSLEQGVSKREMSFAIKWRTLPQLNELLEHKHLTRLRINTLFMSRLSTRSGGCGAESVPFSLASLFT